MTRERLPNRRQHESFAFELAGIRYTGGTGSFPDGRLAEVFLNGAKCGTDADTAAKDAAIVASLALQHDVPCVVIRRALRNRDGRASGPLGVALDLLAALPCPVKDQSERHSIDDGAP